MYRKWVCATAIPDDWLPIWSDDGLKFNNIACTQIWRTNSWFPYGRDGMSVVRWSCRSGLTICAFSRSFLDSIVENANYMEDLHTLLIPSLVLFSFWGCYTVCCDHSWVPWEDLAPRQLGYISQFHLHYFGRAMRFFSSEVPYSKWWHWGSVIWRVASIAPSLPPNMILSKEFIYI